MATTSQSDSEAFPLLENHQLSIHVPYTRLVSRELGLFNIERESYSWWRIHNAGLYHFYLNLEWWILFLVALLYYIVFNLFFGLFYYLDLENLKNASGFSDAFFFSLQTMATIGYGNYAPTGMYLNSVIFVEAWLSMLTDGVMLALLIAKVARPTRLRRTIEFSQTACINHSSNTFKAMRKTWNPVGTYECDRPAFSFRVLNLRERPLCEPNFTLLLFRKEDDKYVMHELDFELNRQNGRIRTIDFSRPYLGLPWEVTHRIDESSPFYKQSREDMIKCETEIIVILAGIDELSSTAFQARWSYLPSEIKFGHKFSDMIRRNPANGTIMIDYSKLSETVAVPDFQQQHKTGAILESADETSIEITEDN